MSESAWMTFMAAGHEELNAVAKKLAASESLAKELTERERLLALEAIRVASAKAWGEGR